MAARTKTDRVTVRLPVSQIEAINALVRAERARNVTEVIYNAVKDYLLAQGAGAKVSVQAEKDFEEIRKMAAQKEALKQQLEDLLQKLR
jgi:Arc/MetJ-type ribon-helix-helix transcriptional regulator